MKHINPLHSLKASLLTTMLLMAIFAQAVTIPDMRFRRLDTREGLSNPQVNSILRDKYGHIWLATPYGLNRYDGYRFRHFYSYEQDTTTITSNRIDFIYEAHDGRLWLRQGMYYSAYDPMTEKADRNPSLWLNKQGVKGSIEFLHIDSKKNYWVKTIDDGFAIFNPTSKQVKTINFGYTAEEFSKEFGVSCMAESKEGMVVCSSQGELLCIDGERGKILWKEGYVKQHMDNFADCGLYVDPEDNYWVMPHTQSTYVYEKKTRRWFHTITDYLRAKGIEGLPDDIIVWDVCFDSKGLLWVATDHFGVYVIDLKSGQWRQFTNVKGDETSMPDITVKHFYIDQLKRLWIATYKNGVAMCSEAMSSIISLNVGDINAICEDLQGYYWLGRNDGGVLKMDPKTHEVVASYTKDDMGIPSDVMVSAYCTRDGSVWFGTYDGGLVQYDHGRWRNYLKTDPGSLFNSNNIWGVTEDKWGYLWIGVLGGGVVRMDRRTGRQRVFNTDNSSISSVWTNSVQRAADGHILVGNSEYYTLIHPGNFSIKNFSVAVGGSNFTVASATTQAFMDSRGLLWLCSPSGVAICDRKSDHTTLIDMKSGLLGSNAVGVCEDKNRTMWVATDHGVSNILTRRRFDGVWTYNTLTYTERDGLQPGPYNQRSMCATRDGYILVGGQEGIDIINTNNLNYDKGNERPVFSDLILFDEVVEVGKEFNGRVVLDKPLDIVRSISLNYSENQFTVLMGSDNGGVNNGTRFLYKLEGFNERWTRTTETTPSITYMSLPSGSYTLCVRMLNDDGTMGQVESQLHITIAAPWYRSWWAVLVYIALIAAALWYAHQRYAVVPRKQSATDDASAKADDAAATSTVDSGFAAADTHNATQQPVEQEEIIEDAQIMDDDEEKAHNDEVVEL